VIAAPRQLSPLSRQFTACLLRLAPDAPAAVLQAAWLASEAVAAGDVCVDLAVHAGQRRWQDALSPGVVFPSLDEWQRQLRASSLVGAPGAFAPLILNGQNRLYLARYWHYEQTLAADLLARAAAPFDDLDVPRLQADLDRQFADNAVEQPDWQRKAAEKAVMRRLCVISGGPGTGKTSTVVRILAALQMQYHGKLTIRLAAPTGKAAARMQEAVRSAKRTLGCPLPLAGEGAIALSPSGGELERGLTPEILAAIPEQAGTLHRLLGSRPDSSVFRHGRANPLPLDVLVVDEASMIDLALMAKLAEALPPQARLILLGDKDQLASVEAGAVFGDICADSGQGGLSASIALLQKSYRFGETSGIGKLARAIRLGEAEQAMAVLADPEFGALAWRQGRLQEHSAALAQRMLDGYRAYLAALREGANAAQLFELFGRFRVLCAHREGHAGVTGLNVLMEDGLRRMGGMAKRETWYHGRPVMIARNDYNLSLFNGDIGIVLEKDGEHRVWFQSSDGKLRDFPPGRLPQHETVYAMTVHKSQGSEFDEVLLALPDEISPVMNRALVYTAVTRAKQRIELWGEKTMIEQAIGQEVIRSSGLKDKLWLE
jgi:exodeoxyribonuclease V alpha subunit